MGGKGMEMELRPESIPHIPYTVDRLYSKHMILFSSTVSYKCLFNLAFIWQQDLWPWAVSITTHAWTHRAIRLDSWDGNSGSKFTVYTKQIKRRSGNTILKLLHAFWFENELHPVSSNDVLWPCTCVDYIRQENKLETGRNSKVETKPQARASYDDHWEASYHSKHAHPSTLRTYKDSGQHAIKTPTHTTDDRSTRLP